MQQTESPPSSITTHILNVSKDMKATHNMQVLITATGGGQNVL